MTDPVLRISHQLGSRYLFPPLDAALLPLIQLLEGYLPAKAPARLDSDPLSDPSTVSAFLSSAQSHIRVGFAFVEDGIGRALTSDAASSSGPSPTWSRIVKRVPAAGLLSSAVAELGGEIGDLFALVGVAARDATDWVRMVFTGEVDAVGFASLAQGDTSADRFFAVWVGYSTVALALLMWFLMSSDSRGLSKTVKEVFKQNGVVVKVRSGSPRDIEDSCASRLADYTLLSVASSCLARLLHEHRAHHLSTWMRDPPRSLPASVVP